MLTHPMHYITLHPVHYIVIRFISYVLAPIYRAMCKGKIGIEGAVFSVLLARKVYFKSPTVITFFK